MTTNKKCVHLIVSGVVQGVCFRRDTKITADSLGINGWVKNLPDASVEIMAEGEELAINQLVTWAHRGPAWARVAKIIETPRPVTGEFTTFEICY